MEKYVIIGSVAAHKHFDFRHPKDIDIIVDKTKPFDPRNITVFRPEIKDYRACKGFEWIWNNTDDIYASPDVLYTLKYSHVFWNIHWQKTINDIMFFRSKGCKLIPELFDILYQDWLVIHKDKKHIKIDVSNERLFSDAVDRVYPHDYIHEMVKKYDVPVYKMLQIDKDRAMLSYDKFLGLPKEYQLRLAREEIYVIALERYLIPEKVRNIKSAYLLAMRDLVTRMTKGWFPRFIIDNLETLTQYEENYYLKFKKGIKHD